MKKLLLLYPNTTNIQFICAAMPILNGIAKRHNWEIEYFDTCYYENQESFFNNKEKIGGYKPGFIKQKIELKKFKQLVIDLQNKIDNYKPDLIAISVMSQEYDYLLSFFKNIKTDAIVAIGGFHVFIDPNKVLETKLFNIVAFGEAESIFPEILINIENNGSFEISGTFTYINNVINKYPKRDLLNIDKLYDIELDFSIFNKNYFIKPFDGKIINRYDIEIARGCNYNCTYCGNSVIKNFYKGCGKYVKTKPINKTIELMEKMVNEYYIDIFLFTDECFLSHQTKWLKEFFDLYKKKINKSFTIQTRPETINDEKINLLISYEIPFQVNIGIESSNEYILNKICNRKCTMKQVYNAFSILNKNNIRTSALFMVGLPYETRKDYFNNIWLYKKIKPSVSLISIFQPFPGQEIRKFCIENNFMTENITLPLFDKSVLNMPKQYLQNNKILHLWRCFQLYANLPFKYWKQIYKCEIDYENNLELFKNLINIRWEKYDYSKIKNDIKLV